MLKVYYCHFCKKTTYFQFEINTNCRWCNMPMIRLNMPFEEFVELNPKEREQQIELELFYKLRPIE